MQKLLTLWSSAVSYNPLLPTTFLITNITTPPNSFLRSHSHMVSLKLAFTRSRPLICWWVIIFWPTTYLPNQCLPKLNYGITTRTLQSFFLRVVLPVLLKEKKTIHNSYIYRMENKVSHHL